MSGIIKIIQLWRRFPAILSLLVKRGTPVRARLVVLLAILYAILPFDLIPEWVPGYGLIDDLFIVSGLLYLGEFLTKTNKSI
ncbi:MAG: DUF1232 domain-containing protein [Desulfotalea sp.]